MKLGAFFHPTGNHIAAWLHPDAQIDAGTNFRHYVESRRPPSAAKFDLMFRRRRGGDARRQPRGAEPLAAIHGIFRADDSAAGDRGGDRAHIGLVATATTSYNEPYHMARKFASLDHISGGRAGWNVVTSANLSEAFNFGREAHYEHDDRYDRAVEFIEVVRGLWDSWDDDAFVRDRASGRYFDPAKLHYLNHKGEHFSVRGPLNVARPPQGHPVIFQAGSSEVGRELAARYGRGGVHTAAHPGRRAGILPGPEGAHGEIRPPARSTEGHAGSQCDRRTHRAGGEGTSTSILQSKIHPDVGLELLSNALGGLRSAAYDLDGPLPEAVSANGNSHSPASAIPATCIRWAREEEADDPTNLSALCCVPAGSER